MSSSVRPEGTDADGPLNGRVVESYSRYGLEREREREREREISETDEN
jgi:hypothetical protein